MATFVPIARKKLHTAVNRKNRTPKIPALRPLPTSADDGHPIAFRSVIPIGETMPSLSRARKSALVKTSILAAAVALLILMAPGALHAAILTFP
jgi:hypothetical protein